MTRRQQKPQCLEKRTVHLFRRRMLRWYRNEGRSYSWRETNDPYKVLLAEMLLQRTQADQVMHVYEELSEHFPTVGDLADAPSRELKTAIRHLGIIYRAERIKLLAKELVKKHGGEIPTSEAELLSLPGIGRYAANAVLVLAMGKNLPLLDPNIVRVLERVFEIKSEKTKPTTDEKLWQAVANLIPRGKAREFNLALIDLGATVCTQRKPLHDECPVRDICKYYNQARI